MGLLYKGGWNYLLSKQYAVHLTTNSEMKFARYTGRSGVFRLCILPDKVHHIHPSEDKHQLVLVNHPNKTILKYSNAVQIIDLL